MSALLSSYYCILLLLVLRQASLPSLHLDNRFVQHLLCLNQHYHDPRRSLLDQKIQTPRQQ
jgi:hypothetical protein